MRQKTYGPQAVKRVHAELEGRLQRFAILLGDRVPEGDLT